MKITVMPKSSSGKFAAIISITFTILILLKMLPVNLPIPTFGIFAFGVLGFFAGIFALIKGDSSLAVFFSVLIGLLLIGLIAYTGVSSLGVFKDFPVKDKLTIEEAGPKVQGDENRGTVSEGGGFVYYIADEKIYKIKNDWSDKTMISESNTGTLFVAGDWIYYSNSSDYGSLYKIKTDGSMETKLSGDDINSMYVYGDWIYYNTKKSMEDINEAKQKYKESFMDKIEAGAVYKIKTDGSGRTKLTDTDWRTGNLKVFGDWVLCESNGQLFKIKTDGSGKMLISENGRIGFTDGDWFIYAEVSGKEAKEKFSLYRIKLNGLERENLTSVENVVNYCFSDGWFYYGVESKRGLLRVRPDGSEKTKLNKIDIWGLDGVIGHWMYISDYSGPRFRVKIDGSVGTRIK
ncbi:MAG: DUF5050 domain-containing protein [Solirubrobacterales bacterium]